jgi:hypothetical protein
VRLSWRTQLIGHLLLVGVSTAKMRTASLIAAFQKKGAASDASPKLPLRLSPQYFVYLRVWN